MMQDFEAPRRLSMRYHAGEEIAAGTRDRIASAVGIAVSQELAIIADAVKASSLEFESTGDGTARHDFIERQSLMIHQMRRAAALANELLTIISRPAE